MTYLAQYSSSLPNTTAASIFHPTSPKTVLWPRTNGSPPVLPDTSWIRLAKILNVTEEVLDIKLETFRLAEAPSYRALSYTSGPAEGVAEDSDPVTFVTSTGSVQKRVLSKTLLRALIQLFDWKETGYFWIDMLCIDQNDIKERSQQVSNMHRIYQQAEAVDIWLGQATDDISKLHGIFCDLARTLLLTLTPSGKTRGEPPNILDASDLLPVNEWRLLTGFFSRRWFHRLWTIQEFALAREIRMFCGPHIVNHSEMALAAIFLSLYGRVVPMNLTYGKWDIAGALIVDRQFLHFMIQQPNALMTSLRKFGCDFEFKDAVPDYETVLAWIYWRSAGAYVTDVRDYVYGLLGLANTISQSLLDATRKECCKQPIAERKLLYGQKIHNLKFDPLEADYSLHPTQVFQNFIVRLLHGHPGLRALSLVQTAPQSGGICFRHNYTAILPSWVPDLANSDRFSLSHPHSVPYASCTTGASRSVWVSHAHCLKQNFTLDRKCLHVYGRRIGTVQQVSHPFPDTNDPSNCEEIAQSLVKILKHIVMSICNTRQTPLETLALTLDAGLGFSKTPVLHCITPAIKTVEAFLIPALAASAQFVSSSSSMHRQIPTRVALTYWILDLIPGIGSNMETTEIAVRIHFLLGDFEAPDQLTGTERWRHSMRKAIKQSFRQFLREFNHVKGHRLFTLLLDNKTSHPICKERQNVTLMGLGSRSIELGDEVWALQGSDMPFALRPMRADSEGNQLLSECSADTKSDEKRVFEFVGEAYVHGVMQGELFSGSADLDLQGIVLR